MRNKKLRSGEISSCGAEKQVAEEKVPSPYFSNSYFSTPASKSFSDRP
jgi:hypothetical protein